MKKLALVSIVVVALGFTGYALADIIKGVLFDEADKHQIVQLDQEAILQEGDIIFQSSQSRQCQAVQLATHSAYSHVGMLVNMDGKIMVLEAVQPVRISPLAEWIRRGKNDHYVVKRLRNADEVLTPEVRQEMKRIGGTYLGKNYDLYFEWSDDRIYCSELVWKVYYQATGLKIGELQKLKSFDLDHPIIQQIMAERYGQNIPYSEEVISPASMFECPLLKTVADVN